MGRMTSFEPTAPAFTITKTTASGKQPAIAPRTRRMSPGDWIQQAVDLAWQYRLPGTLRFRGIFDGDILYSCDDRGREYHLHMNLDHRTMSCNCDWYQHMKPCPHIGALILVLRQIQESAVPRTISGQLQYEALTDYLDAS
jgi:hypothetical protein